MSAFGTRPAVQTSYFNSPTRLFAGELAESKATYSQEVRSFNAESALVCGDVCLKGTINTTLTDGYSAPASPFGVKAIATDDTVGASDFYGIVVRNATVVENVDDASGNLAAGFRDNTMATIAEKGSKVIIGVKTKPAAYVEGGQVYVVNNATTASLPLGTFVEAGGDGIISLPGATYYESKTTITDNTVIRIKLGE